VVDEDETQKGNIARKRGAIDTGLGLLGINRSLKDE